jgi:membrane-bound ClpP family serine protease
MDALSLALSVNTAERLVEVERREAGIQVRGDFEGSVTGYWVKLDTSGAGVVEYNGKKYKVKSVGFTSVTKGTEVELSYAQGVYYAKF